MDAEHFAHDIYILLNVNISPALVQLREAGKGKSSAKAELEGRIILHQRPQVDILEVTLQPVVWNDMNPPRLSELNTHNGQAKQQGQRPRKHGNRKPADNTCSRRRSESANLASHIHKYTSGKCTAFPNKLTDDTTPGNLTDGARVQFPIAAYDGGSRLGGVLRVAPVFWGRGIDAGVAVEHVASGVGLGVEGVVEGGGCEGEAEAVG